MTRRRTAVIVVVLVALWLASTAGAAAAPALATSHAVALALLTPRAAFVAAAAAHLPAAAFVTIFVARLSLGDPLHYALGRGHGSRWLRWVAMQWPGCGGGLQRAERLVRRVGVPVVGIVPTGSVMAVAGAVGMPFVPSMTLNLLGTTVRVVALGLAAAAVPELVVVLRDVSVVAAPVAAAAMVAGAGRAHRRRRRVQASRARHPSRPGSPLGGYVLAV